VGAAAGLALHLVLMYVLIVAAWLGICTIRVHLIDSPFYSLTLLLLL
jgi:hypothetical protein